MMGLLTGDVNVLAATATGNISRAVNSGDTIGLAIAASERSPILPKVPTFAEAGYPGMSAASWVGFFAPSGTPVTGTAAQTAGSILVVFQAVARDTRTVRRQDPSHFRERLAQMHFRWVQPGRPLEDSIGQIIETLFDTGDAESVACRRAGCGRRTPMADCGRLRLA